MTATQLEYVADHLYYLREATEQLLAITARAVVAQPERVTIGEAVALNALSADMPHAIEQALVVLERALGARRAA